MRKFSSILILMLAGWAFSIGVIAQSEINIQITPPNPTSQDPISIQISGTWGNSCVPGDPQVSIENHHITIATSHPSEYCLMVLMPFELKVNIRKLPPGIYTITVTFRSADHPPEEIATTSFQVKEKREEIKFRGTVVDQEHQPGAGWWKVEVENVLFGPEIIGDVAKVKYETFSTCIFYRDADIEVGDRVEALGEYQGILSPGLHGVSLCGSASEFYHIFKYPPTIDWEESGIFPNPVIEHTATLYIDGYVSSVTLLIFDLAGQKVVEETYNTNSATVELSDLDNGLYLYVLIAEKGKNASKSPVKKLLVQQ